MKGQSGLEKWEILKFQLFSHFSHFWLSQANQKAVKAHLWDSGPYRWYLSLMRRTISSFKKKYGFAFKAFLRSKAALKIPVRKKIFFFKNFHCLWCPNLYPDGIWWYHFRFGPMTKNVKNAIFQIWLFWPKKMETIFSANLLIAIYNKFWAFWALEFLKTLRNEYFTK